MLCFIIGSRESAVHRVRGRLRKVPEVKARSSGWELELNICFIDVFPVRALCIASAEGRAPEVEPIFSVGSFSLIF
jgi:hypothetical protein